MKDNLGLGVMINILAGNEDTIKNIALSKDKKIKNIKMSEDALILYFTDKTSIRIFDNGQSCCERRYMTTDDDYKSFKGARFFNCEIRNASRKSSDGEHEIQFLIINTSLGSFTIENHNEHNGYYGGFYMVVENYSEVK
jgi:hypothetical protein